MSRKRQEREIPGQGLPVVRPSIPPVSWLAVSLACGILASERVAWRSISAGGVEKPDIITAVVVLATAALTWLLAGARRRAWAGLLAVSLLAGCALGTSWCVAWSSGCHSVTEARSSEWSVETLSDPIRGRFGSSSRVRIVDSGSDEALGGAVLTAQWPSEGDPPEAGSEVALLGTARAEDPASDPRARDAMRRNSVGVLSVRRIRRVDHARSLRGMLAPIRSWARNLTRAVDGAGGALLDGIVLGDRRRLSGTEAETAFKTTGLTHLVAVSGSHLVVVAACVTAIASWCGLRRRRAVLVAALVCGLYVIFSGVQVSAVRAWIMTVIALAPTLLGRRGDAVAALAVTVIGMLALSPWAVFDIGFQLSVFSVLGLLLLSRLAGAWFDAALPRRARALGGAASMTLVAQASTVPITTRVFGQLSLVAPLANLVVGPIVSLGLVLGLAGLGLAAAQPAAGLAVLRMTGFLLGCGAAASGQMACLPNAAVPATSVVVRLSAFAVIALAVGWLTWPAPPNARRARLVLVGLALISLAGAIGPPLSREPVLTVLDVGQGDAILIRDGNTAVLIDTGPGASEMKSAIARTGVKRLEAVVLTHPHEDHTGGLDGLREVVRVGRLLRAWSSDADSVSLLESGDRLSVGRWDLDVLWPSASMKPVDSANDGSLVVLAQCGTFEALLTGDAEDAVLSNLGRTGELPDVDVVKVGHHGSKVSVSQELLGILKPEIAVLSVGKDNRFGHPAPRTLSLLEACGARTLRTDEAGDVTFRIREGEIAVQTGR